MRTIPALASVTLALLPALASAQEEEERRPEVPPALQARINNAIDRGIEAVLAMQELDGSWRQAIDGYGSGMTGLAAYTLMKSGVPPTHPALERAFDFMRRHPPNKTYATTCVLLAVATRGEKRDRKWIQALTDQLLATQVERGWAYPHGAPDLSNTQFGALGLRAAEAAGAKIPLDAWTRLANAAVSYAEASEKTRSGYAPGGFRYRDDAHPPTGSMTGAGVGVLAICLEHIRGRKQPYVVALERGKAWLAEHFTVAHNPAPGHGNGTWGHYHYYLYGLERVGSLLGLDRFGDHEWYARGAEKLVDTQADSGAWGGQADTCFGLLFLARATAKAGPITGSTREASSAKAAVYGGDDPNADVSLRGRGSRELTIWISSFGAHVQGLYGTGEEAEGPLAVKRVEYLLAERPGQHPLEVADALTADPAKPRPNARYAVKLSPPGPAQYDVVARVTLLDPVYAEEVVLESKPMRVSVGMTERPEWEEYARDLDRNELRTVVVTATASSQAKGPWAAPNVIDGMVAKGWKPLPDDAAPWLQLELAEPVRGNTVVLSPATPTGRRFGRFRIIVNGRDHDPVEGELDRDGRKKTAVPLGKTARIATLRIEFPDHEPGDVSGIGEVEVQRRKK